MAYDLLTTSGINNLINSYKTSEKNKLLTSLNTRKTTYENLISAYSIISNRLEALKSVLADLKNLTTDSIYNSKKAVSSNNNFINVSSSSSAVEGSFSLRVNQLAKNDTALSYDLNSSDVSTEITVPGTHEFVITTGDGSGGNFTSKVAVTFLESDFINGEISNAKVMQKIQNAINTDKALVLSSSVTGSTMAEGSFVIDINGTETTINYSAGTYSEVMDNIISQMNQISGITVEKIGVEDNYQLRITVTDSSKYITIKGDTSTLINELGISVEKEKGASRIVTASVFSPSSGTSQLSLTAKNSGSGFRITSLEDINNGNALNLLGLNLGSDRPDFSQNELTDTAGFIHSTIQLNAKLNFNGVNVERNSNTISDLINGTTINLKSVMAETDPNVSITIEKDASSIKNKIEEFVTKFNDLYTYLRNNSKSVDGKRGALIGDTTASSLLNTLTNLVYTNVNGIGSDKINNLSKIGISLNSDSGISITDTSRLNSVINENLNELVDLFTSSNGIAVSLFNRIESYLGSGGFISKTRTTYNSSLTYIKDRIQSTETRIDKSAELMRQRYTKLQLQLAQLLSNQGYFSMGTTNDA